MPLVVEIEKYVDANGEKYCRVSNLVPYVDVLGVEREREREREKQHDGIRVDRLLWSWQ